MFLKMSILTSFRTVILRGPALIPGRQPTPGTERAVPYRQFTHALPVGSIRPCNTASKDRPVALSVR